MRKSIIVDSSVFISSLIVEDKYYSISRSFFDAIQTENIIITIPIIVFFEILHCYFRLTQNRQKTDLLYQKLIDWNLSKQLRVSNLEASFLAHFAAFHDLFGMKTSDAIVVLTAHRLRQPLITWDKTMLRRSKKIIQALTPESFLKIRT